MCEGLRGISRTRTNEERQENRDDFGNSEDSINKERQERSDEGKFEGIHRGLHPG